MRRCCGRGGGTARRRGTGGKQVYGGAAPFGLALVIGARPPTGCGGGARHTGGRGWRFSRRCWGIKAGGGGGWRPPRCGGLSMAAQKPVWAGRLTLTAAQVIPSCCWWGHPKFFQTVTVGCTALLAAGFGWAFAHFRRGSRGGLPVAGGGYGLPAALCRRALWLRPSAGRGGGAVRGHGRNAGAGGAGACAGGGHHGIRPDACLCGAGGRAGKSGSGLPLPRGAGRCAGVFAAGCTGGAGGPDAVHVPCRWPSVRGWGWRRRWHCPPGRCAGSFPPAGPARAGARGAEAARQKAVRRGRCPERYCRHGERVCQRQMPPKGECLTLWSSRWRARPARAAPAAAGAGCAGMPRRWTAVPPEAGAGEPRPGGGAGSAGAAFGLHPPGGPLHGGQPRLPAVAQPPPKPRPGADAAHRPDGQYSALAGALAQLAGKLGQAGLPDPRRERGSPSCLQGWA